LKKALLTIFTVLILDQLLKIWVKLNFHYGESKTLIPGWFDLQFVENPGMAFGWMIPGDAGKLTLSVFRLVVVTGIAWYLYRLIKEKAHWGYVVCVSMIVAGAMRFLMWPTQALRWVLCSSCCFNAGFFPRRVIDQR